MKRNVPNSLWIAAPVALAVLALGTAAVAGPYPGSLTTFKNGAGNTRNLFTFTSKGITVTGDTSGVNTYFLGGTQLVGFRSIYLVKTDGSATTGISTLANGGFSNVSGSLAKTYYDGAPSLGGYTGYDDGAPGKGFPDDSKWLVVADPTLAGKAASNNNTLGSFGFSSAIAENDIGLDYILKGGATGRAYFVMPNPIVPPAVPEPGSLASLALGSLGLGVLVLRSRQSLAKTA